MLNNRALAASASAPKLYVEDVFSTYLYTGNSSTQTITNGIDLSGKGGLVWIKNRSTSRQHILKDSANGLTNYLRTDLASALTSDLSGFGASSNFSFSSTGFSQNNAFFALNASPDLYASWTFRKAEKFFDVVTWTGTQSNRTISHNLGTVPGCIIVKRLDTTGSWTVYHRSLANTQHLLLDFTDSVFTDATVWNSTTPTSTVFSIGTSNLVNSYNGTYVAYLFAHDAGGFGNSGNDNVISCGSYTGNGSASGPTVTLGWEPQWLLVKVASGGSGGWWLLDNMRGIPRDGSDSLLLANDVGAETSAIGNLVDLTSTGFTLKTTNNGANGAGRTYIYIAIRRGPMKTPTDATKVFNAITYTGNDTSRVLSTSGVIPDYVNVLSRTINGIQYTFDRLRGNNLSLSTWDTGSETPYANSLSFDSQDLKLGVDGNGVVNSSSRTYVAHAFRRAPGFFDVVAYTGDGDVTARTVTHGLTVQPELMIFKTRNAISGWDTYVPSGASNYSLVRLNTNGNRIVANISRTNASSSTTLNVGWLSGNVNGINDVGNNYIAYLFATCPGVSKVGSYTGTGTTQQINCNFTNGSRFVLIKRTDVTGDWYVWDSARGIIPGNDPYLLLNSTAAEVTNTDYIDTYSAGFEISSTAPAEINANGGSFIFLAIA